MRLESPSSVAPSACTPAISSSQTTTVSSSFRRFEVTAAEDQQPVETLAADGADEALRVGVGLWRADRSVDDSDPRPLGPVSSPSAHAGSLAATRPVFPVARRARRQRSGTSYGSA